MATNKSIVYDFNERLVMSMGAVSGATVESILLSQIPGACAVRNAHKANDRNGVDWWVEMSSGHHLGVDAKVRGEDWSAKQLEPSDDLALETWSVVEKKIVGWTRNPDKRTDYILWLWLDTGRWVLVPFPMLCAVFTENWERWRIEYKTRVQGTKYNGNANRNYTSECTFVPRREVWAAIYRKYAGDSRHVQQAEPLVETTSQPPAPLGRAEQAAMPWATENKGAY